MERHDDEFMIYDPMLDDLMIGEMDATWTPYACGPAMAPVADASLWEHVKSPRLGMAMARLFGLFRRLEPVPVTAVNK